MEIPSECPQCLKAGFVDVITKIVEYAYSPTDESLTEFVKGDAFAQFWHDRLGNMVSNWYICRGEQPSNLHRLHKYLEGGLDPSWATVIPIGEQEDRFSSKRVPPEEKEDLQNRIDAALNEGRNFDFSIGMFHERLSKDTLWLTKAEQKAGWLFVELGEMLLYSFEYAFLTRAKQELSDTTRWQAGDFSELTSLAEQAWGDVIANHYHCEANPGENCQVFANGWLQEVLQMPKGEYEEWWNREKDWFIRWKLSNQPMLKAADMRPKDWAYGMCRFGGYLSPEDSLSALPERTRFSPEAEQMYKSRNLVIFPLKCWGKNRLENEANGSVRHFSNGLDTKPNPAIAYFVATFYDDRTIKTCGDMIRALLSIMAQPDIIQIHVREEAKRREQEILLTYARGIAHDLSHPLQAMGPSLFTMLDRVPKHDRVIAKQMRCLTAQMRRIQVMRKNLLDFANAKDALTRSEPVPLHFLLTEALTPFAYEFESRSLQMPEVREDRSNIVLADPELMVNAFSNLVINSLRAYDKKRNADWRLEVRAESLTDNDGQPVIETEFYDTGPGIQAQDLGRVTDPGFTKSHKEKWHGLGLWNVNETVKRLGGKLKITSEQGEWTSVKITLKRAITTSE